MRRNILNKIGGGSRDDKHVATSNKRPDRPTTRPPAPAPSTSSPAKLPTVADQQYAHPTLPEVPAADLPSDHNDLRGQFTLSPPPSSSLNGLGSFRRRKTIASDSVSSSLQSDIGLHLIQSPGDRHPVADLIFVHGLGGSWMKTWSWNHDANIFWPAWLGSDDVLSRLRVFSFGYNANYFGSKNSSGILDFAKTLLFNMDGYSDDSGSIGQYPVIFIAHSMGGLVVKQAFILGAIDDTYAAMMSQVFGIFFLSTPHKGSNFARVLNNILSVSVVSSSKTYVAELNSQSPTLKHINEQFRLVVKDLQIVSFYETHATRIGGFNVMIVDQDSGVLGYPTETSVPMEADHHRICKFASPHDPNFGALKNALRSWVLRLTPHGSSKPILPDGKRQSESDHGRGQTTEYASNVISKVLGIQEPPELRNHEGLDGTCLWIQARADFTEWMQTKDKLGILWLTGLPGTGKSVLARSVIETLRGDEFEAVRSCQCHFFSYVHATRRKCGYALRLIAYQLAQENSHFRERLLQLHAATGVVFAEQEMRVVWSKIFEGILFKIELDRPLYWVFDGLDEADNPVTLINLFLGARPRSPIRILLTSRPASNLLTLANSNRPTLTHLPLTTEDSQEDVNLFIRQTVYNDLPIEDAEKEHVVREMCSKASGSFLWAKLALATLNENWHTQEDIERALNDVPEGMQSLFRQMLLTIEQMELAKPRNYALARRILTWAVCSAEPLTTVELGSALESEFSKMQNMGATILHLCGHFLKTLPSERTGEIKIVPIHETAKSFMLHAHDGRPSFLNEPICHEHLAIVCIRYLCDDAWKASLVNIDGPEMWSRSVASHRFSIFLSENPLFKYVVTHWAYHVSHADRNSQELQARLEDFFENHILAWVHACAVLKNLRLVTRSAQHIRAYGRHLNHRSASSSPMGLGQTVKEDGPRYFKKWASDLIRIVGKFGRNMLERPSCIYRMVAPLCPKASMIYRTYSAHSSLSLMGLSSEVWDDCLARLSVGGERTLSRILCTVTYFVSLISTGGELIVSLVETTEEVLRMRHGEYVCHMAANKAGSLLATAGVETFRVWELSTGRELYRLPKEPAMVSAIQFGAIDTELMIGYDNCEIICYDLEEQIPRWTFVVEEDDGEYLGCPQVMEFSPDGSRLAMEFRGRPVKVWSLLSQEAPPLSFTRAGQALCLLDAIRWHPDGSSIFVLYQDASVVQYHLHGLREIENRETRARNMVISQDGSLMLSSDYTGTLSLWALPKIQLVYSIEYDEYDGLVRDLSFSPDARRFYDIRGPICNVWEPDVLLMPVQEDPEDLSDNDKSDTLYSGPIISTKNMTKSQITALTCDSSGQYYIVGKEDGNVSMFDIRDGAKVRKIVADEELSPITVLAWSPTRKYLAFCGGSRVLTKRVELKEQEPTPKWAIFPCLDFSVDMESVRQFLFSPSERLMLVVFPTSEEVWDLKTKTRIWSREHDTDLGSRWIVHPTQNDLLLCLQRTHTVVRKWPSVNAGSRAGSALRTAPGSPPRPTQLPVASSHSPPGPPDHTTACTRLAATGDNMRYIVSELLPDITSRTTSRVGQLRLEIMATSRMGGSREGEIVPRELLAKISPLVRRLLGCFRDQIVFLNHEFWICTSPLNHHASDSVRRHFFLPRDCIGESMLECVMLTEGGLLVFPKNGEVAVIRNGLKV